MNNTKFPWFVYWVAGLFVMLIIADFAPPAATYTLLAILLIGFYSNEQKTPTRRPDNR